MARNRSAIPWLKTVALIVDLHVPAVLDVGKAHLHTVRSGMLADIHPCEQQETLGTNTEVLAPVS